ATNPLGALDRFLSRTAVAVAGRGGRGRVDDAGGAGDAAGAGGDGGGAGGGVVPVDAPGAARQHGRAGAVRGGAGKGGRGAVLRDRGGAGAPRRAEGRAQGDAAAENAVRAGRGDPLRAPDALVAGHGGRGARAGAAGDRPRRRGDGDVGLLLPRGGDPAEDAGFGKRPLTPFPGRPM
ncbi:MAG: hypothetical protein AVDCRST_MAG68-791, partial [uncultured Gemmatimonadetes bacterium]